MNEMLSIEQHCRDVVLRSRAALQRVDDGRYSARQARLEINDAVMRLWRRVEEESAWEETKAFQRELLEIMLHYARLLGQDGR